MSEIPFVNSLGDAIERSAAERVATRRRRIRRRLTIGVLGFAVAASGVAAASGVFTSAPPEQLATTGVSCYSRADLEHSDVAVFGVTAPDPVDACRSLLGVRGPLVACAGPEVMVFPGGPGTCEKLGLRPLGPEYDAARAKVLRLERRITAIELTNDCWSPDALTARVQTLLDRMPAWRGYRARVDTTMQEGPCGSVTHPDGMGGRSIDGMVDTHKHEVIVTANAARSTLDLLDSPGLTGLVDESAARCYDDAGAEALARQRLESPKHTVTVQFEHFDGESVEPLQSRIDEGCSVIAGFGTTGDAYGIRVVIRH
jgi:hypothetical protein